MNMIRHDHERVQFDMRIMLRQLLPCRFHDPACFTQNDMILNDVAQDAGSVANTDRHEIRPRLGVIVLSQAQGSAPVRDDVGSSDHGYSRFRVRANW